ncbi:MAG: hypothetical protein U0838_02790 [Chloroflexota bacterium]
MLWNLQYYELDAPAGARVTGVRLRPGTPGRGTRVGPPPRRAGREHARRGKFPGIFAWDLALQAVVLSLVDPDRAKEQLLLPLEEGLLHPDGQIPAYEWAFSDTNPPVQAWAALGVYRRERERTGAGDRAFLERMLHGLALNFGWWVNRRDRSGRNLFEGGFLGLDNIAVVDRSAAAADGSALEQADATGWMAFLALGLTEMALELAVGEPVYAELAKHFLGRFVAIGEALASVGGDGLWDPDKRFVFDLLCRPGGAPVRLKAFSLVGLVPLLATRVLDPGLLAAVPGFAEHLDRLAGDHPAFFGDCRCFATPASGGRRLLALVDEHRLVPILDRLLDEDRFWSAHGARSLSRRHARAELPVDVEIDGLSRRVAYEPGETATRIMGGNSNWRGPVWVPYNYLLVHALRQYARYYGDRLRHPYPAPGGDPADLRSVADDLAARLLALYLPDPAGRRPAMGDDPRWRDDPAFRDRLLFYEYFHGETGRGLGASHQTGWTGLLATLVDEGRRPGPSAG